MRSQSKNFFTKTPIFLLIAVFLLASCTANTAQDPSSTAAHNASAAHSSDTFDPSAHLTVGLTYIPNIQFAPFYVAEEKGLFKKHGLHVHLHHHAPQEEMFGRFKAGAENVVYASADEAMQAYFHGLDIQYIKKIYQRHPVAVIVKADSPIKSARDLKGKTIGIPGKFGTNWFTLQLILKSAGLTTDDVQVQSVGYTQQQALLSDKVDAVVGYKNNDGVNFESTGTNVRYIEPLDSESGRLIGPAIFTKSNPRLQMKHFLEALGEAIDFSVKNPEETINISKKYIPPQNNDQNLQKVLAATNLLMQNYALASSPALGQSILGQEEVNEVINMCTFMLSAGHSAHINHLRRSCQDFYQTRDS